MTIRASRDAALRAQAGLSRGALSMVTREAARIPLFALTTGLEVWHRTAGLRAQALRRGEEILQIAGYTPLGRFLPQPQHGDDADAEAERISTAARQPAGGTDTPTPMRAEPAPATRAAAPAEPPAAAVEMGAPGVVTDKVEQVTEALHLPAPTSRDELPLPDFDNISLGSLRARLRALSVEQLVVLREWEQEHAHRLPVVTMLDNRIAKLTADNEAADPGAAYPGDAKRAASPTR